MKKLFSLIKYGSIFFILCLSCRPNSQEKIYANLVGETMGTYYKITCHCPSYNILKPAIDSLLLDINNEVSTYVSDSYISLLNQSGPTIRFGNWPQHFKVNLEKSIYWNKQSNGYFDVSIQPMVNYWGFGYTPKHAVTVQDSFQVDSLRQYIGLDKWSITDSLIEKSSEGQKLGFGAIAKGYAVDMVGEFLLSRGCTDFLVDIGGESTAIGENRDKLKWRVGISTPEDDAAMTDLSLIVGLSNASIATSGNYRNYYEVDGRKYGHTINPKSGYPYQDELLSVTIITTKCVDADAIATACMAMGYSKATTFIAELPEVSACFLVGSEEGSISSTFANGFIQYVISK